METFFLGLLISIFVSLMGGGGAALYLGVLTAVVGLPTKEAVGTSLLVALPALTFGFITQLCMHHVKIKLGNKLILSSIPGILIGLVVAKVIPTKIYDIIMGFVFLLMGLVVLKKAFTKNSKSQEKKQPQWMIYVFGLLSGLMVGVGGLSGGATTAAGLTIMNLNMIDVTGTSTYVLAVMALIGFVGKIFTGPIAWTSGLWLMLGAIAGAILTPIVLQKFDYRKVNQVLTPFLGLVIVYFGVNFLMQGFH